MMKYVFHDVEAEPVMQLSLRPNSDECIDLIGKLPSGSEWIIASLTKDNKFQPNSAGCKGLGLTIDDTYDKRK
jgi:hypothetical protein